ncbi:MAG: flagellar hook capping FlgD N-terminal domain-containing protein [Pseudomonadota bacterium]
METSVVTSQSPSAEFSSPSAPRDQGPQTPTITSDFETFLRMLTVQLENQDPLNPQNAEDFAVQLATFSNVEQSVYTNQLLEDLMGQMAVSGVSEVASWIGREARTATSIGFDGQKPLEISVSPDKDADEAYLIVRNQGGLEIDRVPIATETGTVSWTGATASGFPAPEGVYSFSVESWRAGTVASITPGEVYATVVEARLENGAPMLVLEGGNVVDAKTVSALRDPAL